MKSFFTLSYWLNTQPGEINQTALYAFSSFIAILAIFAFIFYIIKTRKKSIYSRIWEKLYFFFIANFFIGLLFLFFVYEHVPFLSTRVLILIWGIVMAAWFVLIIKSCMQIPKIKAKKAEEDAFKKYIP